MSETITLPEVGLQSGRDVSALTSEIVSAFISHNPVQAADLPGIIASVHAALAELGQPAAASSPVERATPAVPIKKSITPDALISLIDGRPYKTLKRHLSGHGLTPEGYRERYGLPVDYPMAAASYSARRSELAKAMGLGQQRREATSRKTA